MVKDSKGGHIGSHKLSEREEIELAAKNPAYKTKAAKEADAKKIEAQKIKEQQKR